MRRFLTLLIIFTLALTNGAAMATALCRHADARSHAAALESSDEAVAAHARGEDRARQTTGKKAALGDSAGTALAGFLLPPDDVGVSLRFVDPEKRNAVAAPPLSGRSLRPLLHPPLA